MKQARVGIIGAGGICGHVHLPSLSEIEEANIVAICDLRLEKAQEKAAKYNIPGVYWNMYEMIEKDDLDCIFVLVEPDRLYRVAQDCLRAGIPIIMEKPAGTSAHQSNALARLSKELGVMCAVAMNRRHIPVVQEVKRIMSELTTVTQVDGCFMKYTNLEKEWRYMCAFDCDGIHALDLVRYLAGAEATECKAISAHLGGCAVENAWSGLMKFENGCIGTIRSSYNAAARIHQFEMHGDKASAFINLGFGADQCEARIICREGGESMYSMAAGGVSNGQELYISGRELAKTENYYAYYGYKQEDQDFIRAVLNGTKPLCTIEDAAKSMELCEQIHAATLI